MNRLHSKSAQRLVRSFAAVLAFGSAASIGAKALAADVCIDDPLISRKHAVLHIRQRHRRFAIAACGVTGIHVFSGGTSMSVRDVGSTCRAFRVGAAKIMFFMML